MDGGLCYGDSSTLRVEIVKNLDGFCRRCVNEWPHVEPSVAHLFNKIWLLSVPSMSFYPIHTQQQFLLYRARFPAFAHLITSYKLRFNSS